MAVISQITDYQKYTGYEAVKSNLFENISMETSHTGTRSFTQSTSYLLTTTLYTQSNDEVNSSTYRTYYTSTFSGTTAASVYPYRTSTSKYTQIYDYSTVSYRDDTFNKIFVNTATFYIPAFTASYSAAANNGYTNHRLSLTQGYPQLLGDPNSFFEFQPCGILISNSNTAQTFTMPELNQTFSLPTVLSNFVGIYRSKSWTYKYGNKFQYSKQETNEEYKIINVDFSTYTTYSTQLSTWENTSESYTWSIGTVSGVLSPILSSTISYTDTTFTFTRTTFNAAVGYSTDKYAFDTNNIKAEYAFQIFTNDNFSNLNATFNLPEYTTYSFGNSFQPEGTGTINAILLYYTTSNFTGVSLSYPIHYSYISTSVSKSSYKEILTSSSTRKSYYSTSYVVY